MSTWRPGQRRVARALENPYVGVPVHLHQPLWNWIQLAFETPTAYRTDRIEQIAIDLRISTPGGSPSQQIGGYLGLCNQDPEFMLDLTEALLERYGYDDGRGAALRTLLTSVNSAYAVKDDYSGLEERVPAGVKELVQEAVDAAGGSAGDHLTTAWNEAYGRVSDPPKAYSEAIKAVEAALAPRVTPKNQRQTLGTMIADVRQAPQHFVFAMQDGPNSDGVEMVLSMMKQLWEGQTSRHGGLRPTRPETAEEARAAVHLGAALVQWGVSGAFDRR